MVSPKKSGSKNRIYKSVGTNNKKADIDTTFYNSLRDYQTHIAKFRERFRQTFSKIFNKTAFAVFNKAFSKILIIFIIAGIIIL